MGDLLSTLDIVIFVGSLITVMGIGLWVGRKEEDSEDFYLAGRNAKWWGVAGSVFGSNVSANHMAGMMGVGFAFGFAQSHFEITAIAGLLMLCYAFLPVYRKLKIFTLSDYLGKRYGEASRLCYALIMIAIMVVVMMVPAFYYGSRSVNELLQGSTGDINQTHYIIGIIAMAVITGTYTVIGGLKAVIITDVIQSVLVLVGGIAVAIIVFSNDFIGGWSGMRAMDAAAEGADKMRLYNPSDHPKLPWTGVLSGLMVLHFYYWGANQFIVQRALAASSLREARRGIIAAGFFKLLIPFFSIGTGIAAYYLFANDNVESSQDAVFVTLLREYVAPLGYGLVGIIAAGLIGAILSSIDSMLNSAATIITFDVYKRYIDQEANEKKMIRVGRIVIVALIVLAAFLTILIMNPNSKDSFFLYVARYQGYLVSGVVVSFLMGMLWPRGTEAGSVVAIVMGVVLSFSIGPFYGKYLTGNEWLVEHFGEKLNFFHAAFVAALICVVLHAVCSLCMPEDEERSRLTFVGLKLVTLSQQRMFFTGLFASIGVYAILGVCLWKSVLNGTVCAWVAALYTFGVFTLAARKKRASAAADDPDVADTWLGEDLVWGGLLAACAVYMMYYFY